MIDINAIAQQGAVIVYQMGKVGSTTIYESLQNAGLNMPIYKVHYLSERGVREGRNFYSNMKRPVRMPYEGTSSQLLEIIRSPQTVNWKVITCVREPVARDISQFLQLLDLLHPELIDDDGNPEIPRIVRSIKAQFMTYDQSKNYTCAWFDAEMKEVFDIDVYKYPFNYQSGYTRIRRDNVDLLVLRLEDLDRCFSGSVARFLGVAAPLQMMRKSSRSAQKYETAYKEGVYKEILAKVTIPRSVCEKVYASKYATHFYSPNEIEGFIKRWSKN